MKILNEISEFFNIIEPWLVFFVFIIQVSVFVLILRQRIKRDILIGDILNNALEKLKDVSSKKVNKEDKNLSMEDKKEAIKDALMISRKK